MMMIIVRYEFGLNNPVSVSSICIFVGLPKLSFSISYIIQLYFWHLAVVHSHYMS